LNGAGTAPDTLYITDQVANSAAGQIDKYSLVGGTWVARGSISVAQGITGLTGVVNGSAVTLFATPSRIDGLAGTMYRFADSTGYNVSVSGTAGAIATASFNEAFRGVALVPSVTVVNTAPTVDLNGAAAGTGFTNTWSKSGPVKIADAANA